MSKITLDSTLKAKLNGLNEQVQICDETGKTVGWFVPEEEYKKLVIAWAKTQVTLEELQAATKEPGGRSLAEIWKSLGQA